MSSQCSRSHSIFPNLAQGDAVPGDHRRPHSTCRWGVMTESLPKLLSISPVLRGLSRVSRLMRAIAFHPGPLKADLGRFGTIVWLCQLLEPRMVQSLFGSDALSRVVDENSLEKVGEVFEEVRVGRVLWDDLLYDLSVTLVPTRSARL